VACGHAPGQVLKAPIERHNQFEATGVDLNFAKGSTQLNQYIGDLSNKPNLCIGALTGKLYALWPFGLQNLELAQALKPISIGVF